MKKKVTSTDIAKAAGVSQATVSMVLNKKYNVSFSKRDDTEGGAGCPGNGIQHTEETSEKGCR